MSPPSYEFSDFEWSIIEPLLLNKQRGSSARMIARFSTGFIGVFVRVQRLSDSKVVGIVLLEARRDGSKVFELIEEALDEDSESVELGAERTNVDAACVGLMLAKTARGAAGLARKASPVIAAIGEEERPDRAVACCRASDSSRNARLCAASNMVILRRC